MWTYILASQKNGTLYVGATGDLVRRVREHRVKTQPDSFTARYGVTKLVLFEEQSEPRLAIQREKTLKKWKRAWKIALIEDHNPDWHDLWPGICR
ncbi:GIY-YIG nuclease family protein [Jannaschia marina]|uniref:GIY-YIG nuclease family protein n=1 Tax=Jannaschia marina TaxID=2741674 RepID=UPI0015C95C19|nr:GIY-YIG nuclease family protein [Jannaschia marina]